MSAPAVRAAFRAAWPIRLPGLAYYDTVNTMPDAALLPDAWATIIFGDPVKTRISIGSPLACHREAGTIAVVLMTRTGSGDALAGAQYENVRTAFNKFVGAGGYLQVLGVQPPKDSMNDTPAKSEYNKTVIEIDYSYESYE